RLQLADHFFGNLGVLRRLSDIERGERQSTGLALVAVAASAVTLHDRVEIRRVRGNRFDRSRLCGRRLTRGGPRRWSRRLRLRAKRGSCRSQAYGRTGQEGERLPRHRAKFTPEGVP